MSTWRDERNAISVARLRRTLPEIFPQAVLVHAFANPWTPPSPRLAIESYWSHHPLRADRMARARAARSGAPPGWQWRLSGDADSGLPRSFRVPPAPFRDPRFAPEPGHCCICGQPVFRYGWHVDLWSAGVINSRARWHACCVAAWKFWIAPNGHVRLLRRLQRRRCADTGRRLLRTSEVDHRTPLFQVWRDQREKPWPDLLAYWGMPNLQVVNRSAHASKSAVEAAERAGWRALDQSARLRSSSATGL